MELDALLKGRYSVRKFADRQVSEEDLAAILEAGRLAPTAKNQQPQRFYVVRTPEKLQALADCSPCIYGAKTVIVVCSDTSRSWTSMNGIRSSDDTDCAIATTQMMLKCTDLGLGSCYVFMFDADKTRQALALPDEIRPHAFLPIGYPDAEPSVRHTDRIPLSDMVTEL